MKGESNDSPEIPDRRGTSDIPGLPLGGNKNKGKQKGKKEEKRVNTEMDQIHRIWTEHILYHGTNLTFLMAVLTLPSLVPPNLLLVSWKTQPN